MIHTLEFKIYFKKTLLATALLIACWCFPGYAPSAPLCAPGSSCGSSGKGILESLTDHDLPGLADPRSPFVFPPIVRMELKTRPIVVSLYGFLENADSGQRVYFHDDMGYAETGVLWDNMYRLQLGRLSFRVHYSGHLRGFTGDTPNELHWPVLYGGLSLEFVDTPSLRVGIDGDVYVERPRLVYANTPIGAGSFEQERPVTAGLHAAWNPVGYFGLSGSLESLWRMSISPDPRMQEVEVSAGLKTPELALGTLATRLGWRYTTFRFSNGGPVDVNATWSGIFADFAYYY